MSRESRRYSSIIGAVLIGIAVLFFLNASGVVSLRFFDIVQFEQLTRSSIGATPVPSDWSEERRVLLEELAKVQSLKVENEQLREVLNFTKRTNYSYTIANVISRDPFVQSILYIDAGSSDGIAVGQPVSVGEGTMIGKIIHVSASNATLELMTGDSSRIAVKVLDDAGTIGVVRGTLGTNARLEFIRDVAMLEVGTSVVTSGLEPLVPQGLLVGTVQKVVDNPDELFAYADIVPSADLNQLSIVTVLRGL